MRLAWHNKALRATIGISAALVTTMMSGGSPAWATAQAGPDSWRTGHQVGLLDPPADNGFFGSAVELSADGSTAVVGAYYQDSGTGAAYVYRKQHGTWSKTATLTASDATAGDYFGSNLAISANGSLIAVGAWGRDNVTGGAYVFKQNAGQWKQIAEFSDPDGVSGDGFGTGVAMTPSGSTMVIGANGHDSYAGAAYVFNRHRGHWKRAGELVASDATEDAGLGTSAAIAADGSTILLGAYLARDDLHGAAYVFTKTGGDWSQSAELTASDGTAVSYFGMQVGLSSDGSTAVVGADAQAASTGAAYVFQNHDGSWSQTSELQGSDTVAGDQFGSSVAISGNGQAIAAGALEHDSGRGAVYVFKAAGAGWTQQTELTASDAQEGDYLGSAAAFSTDGSTIISGAWGRTGGNGGAYLFHR